MDEADLIPISALQHYAYCPRQCALIHLEQVWADNSHTMEGHLLHEKAHSGEATTRKGLRITTDLPLCSHALGVTGQADVVEFRKDGGQWLPFPVEYKKGRPHKGSDADQVQLCAQALCLEEMLEVPVPEGALFYGQQRRRSAVIFDDALRERTQTIAAQVQTLFRDGITPPPSDGVACESCSLQEFCLPAVKQGRDRSTRYVQQLCQADPDDQP